MPGTFKDALLRTTAVDAPRRVRCGSFRSGPGLRSRPPFPPGVASGRPRATSARVMMGGRSSSPRQRGSANGGIFVRLVGWSLWTSEVDASTASPPQPIVHPNAARPRAVSYAGSLVTGLLSVQLYLVRWTHPCKLLCRFVFRCGNVSSGGLRIKSLPGSASRSCLSHK